MSVAFLGGTGDSFHSSPAGMATNWLPGHTVFFFVCLGTQGADSSMVGHFAAYLDGVFMSELSSATGQSFVFQGFARVFVIPVTTAISGDLQVYALDGDGTDLTRRDPGGGVCLYALLLSGVASNVVSQLFRSGSPNPRYYQYNVNGYGSGPGSASMDPSYSVGGSGAPVTVGVGDGVITYWLPVQTPQLDSPPTVLGPYPTPYYFNTDLVGFMDGWDYNSANPAFPRSVDMAFALQVYTAPTTVVIPVNDLAGVCWWEMYTIKIPSTLGRGVIVVGQQSTRNARPTQTGRTSVGQVTATTSGSGVASEGGVTAVGVVTTRGRPI